MNFTENSEDEGLYIPNHPGRVRRRLPLAPADDDDTCSKYQTMKQTSVDLGINEFICKISKHIRNETSVFMLTFAKRSREHF